MRSSGGCERQRREQGNEAKVECHLGRQNRPRWVTASVGGRKLEMDAVASPARMWGRKWRVPGSCRARAGLVPGMTNLSQLADFRVLHVNSYSRACLIDV